MNINQEKRRALGRGLETLLPAARAAVSIPVGAAASGQAATQIAGHAAAAQTMAEPANGLAEGRALELEVEQIDRNPYQTRKRFDEAALDELAASIKTNGVMQPIVVRHAPAPNPEGRFQLIMGERRWLASQRAGKKTIPAVVREVSNQQALEMTIIENLQREDLGPMEQAHAFERLAREFGLTQEQISQRTGKDRTSIANYIRLLKLPGMVQHELEHGFKITFSHAKQLLTLSSDQQVLYAAKQIVEKELSVGQTESLIFDLKAPLQKLPLEEQCRGATDPNVRAAEDELARLLGTRVRIRDKRGRGTIVVEYSDVSEFERIVEVMGGK